MTDRLPKWMIAIRRPRTRAPGAAHRVILRAIRPAASTTPMTSPPASVSITILPCRFSRSAACRIAARHFPSSHVQETIVPGTGDHATCTSARDRNTLTCR